MYTIGTGFCLGSGNPKTAKIGLLLEAPGKEEILYRVDDPQEIVRRKIRYPGMDLRYLGRGMPVVGRSGGELFTWGLANIFHRSELFIDNTIRCLPPKSKSGQYPTGNIRKVAESYCRQYDRWNEFRPTVTLVNIHPAAISREPTPLPLQIKTFEKAKHFYLNGERPLVLCGGKAVHGWLGYGSTISTWLGHLQPETALVHQMRVERWRDNMALSTTKTKKAKKLTAKSALALLLQGAHQAITAEGEVIVKVNASISEEQYKEMLGLIAIKTKKEKVT